MSEAVKIPRPSSAFLDDSGNVAREWISFLQKIGVVTSPLVSLPQSKIWIGNSASTPVAYSVSGDAALSSSGVLTLAYTANFKELAQDAIGAMVDTSLVYVDATPLLTRAALTGEVTASQGSNATTVAASHSGSTHAAVQAAAEATAAAALAAAVTAWSTFTPSRTGWTDVGSPTVTGRKCKIGNVEHFQVKVVPGTTIATTAGTSYIALPVTAAGIGGAASMDNITAMTTVGNCVIDQANSRVYVPTQGASGNTFIICGWYEV